jgi:hypothetical protein
MISKILRGAVLIGLWCDRYQCLAGGSPPEKVERAMEATRGWWHGLTCRIGSGVIAGLAGGLVFGAMMHVSGALPLVARLVDGQSVLVGWAVHLAIAAFVGITFGLVVGAPPRFLPATVLLGGAYGWFWWVLGGLTLMPLRLGMGLFVFNADAFRSLAGHLAFGFVLGAVFHLVPPIGHPAHVSARHAAGRRAGAG